MHSMSRLSKNALFDFSTKSHQAGKPAPTLLDQLLDASLVLTEDWENLPANTRTTIMECSVPTALLQLLEKNGLLTDYQISRIEAGRMHGLILGNYRVLDRLGAGAMGVVLRGEHRLIRRQVAIKVLPLSLEEDRTRLLRFYTEMRVVAQLQHPNIVAAIDAGEADGETPTDPVLHYFVMEYVPGVALENLVTDHGPLPVAKACDFAYQIASALAEANKHHLVHRDIKPSNVLVTPEGQVKLLDFGLARHFRSRHTELGALLGTIDYMAPEQAQDSASVDIRADIYALGATLFWCLTAKPPFATEGTLIQAVARRLMQQAPSVRDIRPEVPAGLDEVMARMMALKPEDRYATPQAVMQSLLPFLNPDMAEQSILSRPEPVSSQLQSPGDPRSCRVLIVDDQAAIRDFARCILEGEGLHVSHATDGEQGLEMARGEPIDLVLLDIDMPTMRGPEVLRLLRESPPRPHLKIIMFSGRGRSDEMAAMLLAGADGYLIKPFSPVQLIGQVKSALRLKNLQSRADLLNRRLIGLNSELERSLGSRDSDLIHVRNALVLALCKLVKLRDGETGAHVWRLQRYSRCLAEAAASQPKFGPEIDSAFIDLLECCAPLHDIGKVGIPDDILLKPGKLTLDERLIMQAHTIIGAEALKEVADHHGSAVAFLQMASDVARHHHERYDGSGYPDRLVGDDIPLAARIVAIGDVYDALRSRRVYKPALSHTVTIRIMTEGSAGHFDPTLLHAFERCGARFEQIFRESH